MNIIDLATKTLQLAIQTAVNGIKSVVDAIKAVVDATKTKVDTIDTRTNTINTNVNTANASLDILLAGRVVKSVQRGIIMSSNNTTTHTVTISSVNTAKSFLTSSYKLPASVTGAYEVAAELKNSTTIELTSGSSINGHFITWQVIEFY